MQIVSQIGETESRPGAHSNGQQYSLSSGGICENTQWPSLRTGSERRWRKNPGKDRGKDLKWTRKTRLPLEGRRAWEGTLTVRKAQERADSLFLHRTLLPGHKLYTACKHGLRRPSSGHQCPAESLGQAQSPQALQLEKCRMNNLPKDISLDQEWGRMLKKEHCCGAKGNITGRRGHMPTCLCAYCMSTTTRAWL